jgi:cell division protein FtsA
MLVAIDIGTTKICVLIAQKIGENQLEIIGIGKAPSLGLARGVVVDILPAVQSIKAALKEAELMAGYTVESAVIGISGSHIQSLNSHGVIPIKNGDVRQSDVTHVIAAAKAIPLPEGQQILHVLPQFFVIDGHHRVNDPIGMHGIRLEAQVHIITGAIASVQNLIRCCEMAGIKVQDIVLEPLASADAVLSADERTLGIGILDIGGGTSDLALYQQGSIRHTHVYPIAGNIFTNDIALCLRTTIKDAERVKRAYGCVYAPYVTPGTLIDIEMAQGQEMRTVSALDVYEIVESRTHELLILVKEEISKNKLESYIPAGMVITGGGSLLHGMKERAEEILHMPVRIGRPHVPLTFRESLNSPIYATGYGLLLQALKKSNYSDHDMLTGPVLGRVFCRMKSWIFDFF